MKQQRTTQQGFTIIEVMLVLAMAALIFLMIFVALPQLQRGQRDTARKSDVDQIAAAVTQYTSNNRGKFPTATSLKDYVGDLSNLNKDSISVREFVSSVSPDNDSVVVVRGAKCDESNGSGVSLKKGSSKQFVVVTKLEAGGSNGVGYCLDS